MPWRKRAAPHARIVVPQLQGADWLQRLVVYQAEGAHQVAEATVMTAVYPGQQADVAAWADETPVRLQYGWWSDDSEPWFGYVASSRVEASESDDKLGYAISVPVTYTLVGASMPMQTQASRAWQDVTASYIARTVAARYTLAPVVETSAARFDQRMQTSSDWQFLADLADRVGYRLYLDKAQLWFVDRRTPTPSSDGSVPQFWSRRTPGVLDSLRQFQSTVGDTDPAGGLRARNATVGLSRVSGRLSPAVFSQPRTDLSGVSRAPMLTRQYTERPALSYRDASGLLQAETDWLWVHARGITDGDPRLKPGALVDMRGGAIGTANSGLWMVRGATHRIDVDLIYPQKTQYTSELVLGRDQVDRLGVMVPAAPAPVPDPVLVDGRWRASYVGRV